MLLLYRFLLLALLLPAAMHAQGWEWRNPQPHGQLINDVLMLDHTRGVAVCNNGFYLYTADGGRSWTTYRLGNANLERIILAADGNLIVAADKRRIYRSTDNAYSWELVYGESPEARVSTFDLHRTPDGTLLAMLNGPHFVRSTDNGLTWQRFAEDNMQISIDNIRSFSVQSNTQWYLVSNRNVFRTTDAGRTWNRDNLNFDANGLQRFVFVDSLYGFQLREGQLLRTHDGGASWEEMDIFGFNVIRHVQAGPALGNSVFCMSLGRYLINASTDGGESWNISLTENAFADSSPRAMHFVDARLGFVVGYGGRILRTDDGGQSWAIVHGIGYIGTVTDLLFLDDEHGIATSYSPTVLLTSDGGYRWNESVPSPDHSCFAITSTPGGLLYMVSLTRTYDFDLLFSSDRGRTWELRARLPLEYSSSNPEMAQSILAISENELLVGATYSLLLRSSDGGWTWTRNQVQRGAGSPFSTGYSIFYFPPSTFIYLQSNGFQISTDGGELWTGRLTPGARTLWDAQFLTPEIGYGLISGEFSRTTDGGLTWETETGFRPQLFHFTDPDHGVAIWDDMEQDDLTFLMRSSDGGRNWEKHSMGERAGYGGWYFQSPDRIWGYGTGGMIRYSGDGGIVGMRSARAAAAGFSLAQGYPNPFSPSRHAQHRIPVVSVEGGAVQVAVHDLLGRVVTSFDAGRIEAGLQTVHLPASRLRDLPAGSYVYRVTIGNEMHTGRLLLR
ncbi:MAG: T9SS type A sorting domain-containing protein [Bacteroidetes bacterium]|nr:T9SS type A sorting domain-containing protein [Bacteroidota bacterium]